ncbi:MAG: 23S rRNA (uracil(1939)-C(5))-methyltransferase RlmD [Paludibacteraceae bacterium]|nr:23S rRNA (uracil(1939)-C(5))-methyltransferase RlmD [Paludibacteraceae bacterium]
MKKKNLPLLPSVTITGIGAEGKAITRVPMPNGEGGTSEIVCFVPYCVPGDVVDLQVTKKKHSYMEARVERIVTYSDQRCAPECPHYGECGGCKWQILPYTEQLRYKQQQVADNITRIGKVALPEISPIIGSKHIYEYRNKLEFSCADRKWLSWDAIHAAGGLENIDTSYSLGFHIPNCFDKVLDIETCRLMPDINNRIRNGVRTFAREHGLTFYNEHSHQGQLRTLILRTNHKGEMMLIVSFGEKVSKTCMALLEWLHREFPEITSLLYVENMKMNDTIADQEIHVYYGQDHIIEEMEGLQFKVGPKSFYQTNTEQAYELYKVAREFAALTGDELVYDLYTGTGTIANFVARQAKQVIGIEYVPEAIEDAKVNSAINGISNTLFFAGDMKDVLSDAFLVQHGRPDVIITDPPRAGMHEDVIATILRAEPKRIVYVSCNPATQARDLAMLDALYSVAKVQPVDMFPHTQHVENVVLLIHR